MGKLELLWQRVFRMVRAWSMIYQEKLRELGLFSIAKRRLRIV